MKKSIGLLLLTLTLGNAGGHNTPNWWNCYHKNTGSWSTTQFGRYASSCDVNPFGDPQFVSNKFQSLIFDDSKDRTNEKKRYMNALIPTIKDSATYYIEQKKPNITQVEKDAWVTAILAVANQESIFTHYRKANLTNDKNLKMIRGDAGHGHGLMQIDDRWHYSNIKDNGAGWQIFKNINAALDIYYATWKKSATVSCVSSPTNYYARIRSVYSAYNGGPSKICRWTNSNATWAQNDINFKEKLDNKIWENNVDDMSSHSTYDVSCYLNGNEDCADISDSNQWDNHVLELNSGEFCILENEKFQCVEQQRDSLCLGSTYNKTLEDSIIKLSLSDSNSYPKVMNDRTICYSSIPKLYEIGSAIKANVNINLRRTPGGVKIGKVKTGTVYQILDFEVDDKINMHRYYKVKTSSGEGYIYAGNKENYDYWTKLDYHHNLENIVIPMSGDMIKVKVNGGINLRATPGGEYLGRVPQNTEVKIVNTVVIGIANSVYYKVIFNDTLGYIYGGSLLPNNTLAYWTKLNTDTTYYDSHLKYDILWTSMYSCGSSSCDYKNYVLSEKIREYCVGNDDCNYEGDKFKILEDNNQGWTKIKLERDSSIGWIEKGTIN